MIILDSNKQVTHKRVERKQQRAPRKPVNRRALLLGVSGVLAIVALIAGILAIQHYLSNRPVAAETKVRSDVTIPSTFLSLDDETKSLPVSIKLTAPTSWKTKADNGSQVKVLDAKDFVAAHFSFKPDAPGGAADGDMILENIQAWLGGTNPTGGYGELKTPAQKSTFINFLKSLGQRRDISPSDSKNLISLVGQSAGFQNLRYVETDSQQLTGVMYETVISQNGGYQPVIVSYLTGNVSGRAMYLRSIITYQDAAYGDMFGAGGSPTVDQVKQAITSFAGGNVDSGMSKLADHFSDMLKSFKIDASGLSTSK